MRNINIISVILIIALAVFKISNATAESRFGTVEADDAYARKVLSDREKFKDKSIKPEKECPICPEMIIVSSGSFDMGSNDGLTDEKPIHRVTIAKSFAIGKYEVTQSLWKSIMGNNPSAFKSCGDNCPIDSVSWDDVQEFIKKINEKYGKKFRLPTEAEWEYACKGGQQTLYCGGNDINEIGWYGANSTPKGNSNKSINPVGFKSPNAFGLYDMSGNVAEWVQDSYHDSYDGAPSDGSEWGKFGLKRILRGGSWALPAIQARASNRKSMDPSIHINNFGFRLAFSID